MGKRLVVSIFLFSCFAVKGQDSLGKITLAGFVEAYYAYSFNNPADKNIPLTYNFSRHNDLAVNLALASLKYESAKARANVGLQSGTYAGANYAGEPSVLRHLYDANAGYKISRNMWLDAGVFGASHIGFEGAVSTQNWTLTRSLCAENSPYYETGVKLTFEKNEVTISGLLLNGWQNIQDNNSNKGLGTQIIWKPTDSLTLNSSTYYGNEKPDSIRQMRFFHDLYLQYQASKRLGLILGFDFGMEQRRDTNHALLKTPATWYSPVVILRYGITKKTAFAARVEYFSDRHQAVVLAGKPFHALGYSLTLNYTPLPGVIFKAEGKSIKSEEKIFMKGNRFTDTNTQLACSMSVAF